MIIQEMIDELQKYPLNSRVTVAQFTLTTDENGDEYHESTYHDPIIETFWPDNEELIQIVPGEKEPHD